MIDIVNSSDKITERTILRMQISQAAKNIKHICMIMYFSTFSRFFFMGYRIHYLAQEVSLIFLENNANETPLFQEKDNHAGDDRVKF